MRNEATIGLRISPKTNLLVMAETEKLLQKYPDLEIEKKPNTDKVYEIQDHFGQTEKEAKEICQKFNLNTNLITTAVQGVRENSIITAVDLSVITQGASVCFTTAEITKSSKIFESKFKNMNTKNLTQLTKSNKSFVLPIDAVDLVIKIEKTKKILTAESYGIDGAITMMNTEERRLLNETIMPVVDITRFEDTDLTATSTPAIREQSPIYNQEMQRLRAELEQMKKEFQREDIQKQREETARVAEENRKLKEELKILQQHLGNIQIRSQEQLEENMVDVEILTNLIQPSTPIRNSETSSRRRLNLDFPLETRQDRTKIQEQQKEERRQLLQQIRDQRKTSSSSDTSEKQDPPGKKEDKEPSNISQTQEDQHKNDEEERNEDEEESNEVFVEKENEEVLAKETTDVEEEYSSDEEKQKKLGARKKKGEPDIASLETTLRRRGEKLEEYIQSKGTVETGLKQLRTLNHYYIVLQHNQQLKENIEKSKLLTEAATGLINALKTHLNKEITNEEIEERLKELKTKK